MFRRITVLSLLLVYLGTSVGFAMSLHFCGTKISDVRLNNASPKPCCTNEIEKKADKCCKDLQIKIKISDQQRTIQSAKIPSAINLDLFIVPSRVTNLEQGRSISISRLHYRGPPVISDIPLTIQNCIFRI